MSYRDYCKAELMSISQESAGYDDGEDMHDKDYIDLVARRIAWVHWKALNPADVCRNDLHLWDCLCDRHREAYRAAALEVASM